MENTNVPVPKDETTPTVEIITEGTPKIAEDLTTTDGKKPVTEETEKLNGEKPIIEEPLETETMEKKGDEIVSATTVEEPTKVTDEQENAAGTNTTVPPTCLSPGRANVPLKEVNESEKEESTVHTNGTDNTNSKKRELEQEDEPTEETTTDNDERTVDATKKIKISESTDTPIMESKEPEKTNIVNGNTAVEV